MKTYLYRVLMKDYVDGEEFYFTMFYKGMGMVTVSKLARYEFNCEVIKVEKV